MQISVLAFGIAKDIIGDRQIQLDVGKRCQVSTLKDILEQKYPEFSKLKSLTLAVNQSYASDDLLLTEKDEVVIIPPVSGG